MDEAQEIETSIVRVEEPHTGGMAIFDVDTSLFAAALDRRKANRDALIQWVRAALVEGIDFGKIQVFGRESKPSLWKPGAEKICGMLGVIPTFPNMKDYEQAAVSGVALEHILLRCHLLDGHGNVVAEGAGARSISKEKGDVNKTLKMASKSAHIDATLRMAGLSEIFTQDLEDMASDPMPPRDKTPRGPKTGDFTAADKELERQEALGKCRRCGADLKEYTSNAGKKYRQCTWAHDQWSKARSSGVSGDALKQVGKGHTYKMNGGDSPARKDGPITGESVAEGAGQDSPAPNDPLSTVSATPAPSFQSTLEGISQQVAERIKAEQG